MFNQYKKNLNYFQEFNNCGMQAQWYLGVLSLLEKKNVGWRLIYVINIDPKGEVNLLYVRLVSIGYTQIYGLDYGDSFCVVAKKCFSKSFCCHVVNKSLATTLVWHNKLYFFNKKFKNFIQNYQLTLLFRGTLDWFANFDVLFMGSNSPHEFGLGSSILLFKMLD